VKALWDGLLERPDDYWESCGPMASLNRVIVQYDERTGIAYTRPSVFEGADTITTEEIDELGLGPNGDAHCAACGDVAEIIWLDGTRACRPCYRVRGSGEVRADIAKRRASRG
jgi:hypothetical protein